MAVRSLPPRERRIGIVGGAAAAVVLRVALTLVAARLLTIRVSADRGRPADPVDRAQGAGAMPAIRRMPAPAPKRFWQAIWYIVVADLTMSTDNILAIAGASNGHFGLIMFGLALSIPFVVFSSNLLANLMDRFPWTDLPGGRHPGEGGRRDDPDRSVHRGTAQPGELLRYGVEGVFGAWVCSFTAGCWPDAERYTRPKLPPPGYASFQHHPSPF